MGRLRRFMMTMGGSSVTAPAAVTGLSATAISSTRIDLAWTDAATNETEYRVYRSTDNVTYALLATIAADSTSYSNTGLTMATQYYYKVAPYNTAGETLSDAVNATTPFLGILDAYTASLVHVYNPAARLLESYTGNLVRLRRASDNAEADFGYVAATGELNLAAIATWAGGASSVVTVYDQKGSDNVTQATAGAQPVFAASAQNSHAGMSFNGTSHCVAGAFTNGGALSQPFNVFAVAQLDATVVGNSYRYAVDSDDDTNRMAILQHTVPTPDSFSLFAGTTLHGNTSSANWNVFSVLYNGASSQFWIQGASQAIGNAGANNADGLTIGASYAVALPWKGYINGIIIADPSFSTADRQAIETALMTYWGIS